jgi:hypothetical protein
MSFPPARVRLPATVVAASSTQLLRRQLFMNALDPIDYSRPLQYVVREMGNVGERPRTTLKYHFRYWTAKQVIEGRVELWTLVYRERGR